MRGDGSIYKRGKVWWAKYVVNGVSYSESTGTTVKDDARAFLRVTVQKSRVADWIPPDKQRITVDELVADAFKNYELAGKDKALKRSKPLWDTYLKPFFGGMRADKVGTQQFRDYQLGRVKTAANATINREMQLLYAAFSAAVDHEPPKLQRKPKFPWLPEDNARRVFIDQDVAQKLKKAASERSLESRVWLEIAFTYGWRRGEVMGLRVRHISLADKAIRLDTTKNGDGREVPITPTLLPLLTALVTGRGPEESLLGMKATAFFKEWQAICEAAGVTAGRGGIIPHDMRRSSARNKRRAGVSTSVIMELQGWRTESMFRRYAIVDMTDKAAAIEMEQAYTAKGNA